MWEVFWECVLEVHPHLHFFVPVFGCLQMLNLFVKQDTSFPPHFLKLQCSWLKCFFQGVWTHRFFWMLVSGNQGTQPGFVPCWLFLLGTTRPGRCQCTIVRWVAETLRKAWPAKSQCFWVSSEENYRLVGILKGHYKDPYLTPSSIMKFVKKRFFRFLFRWWFQLQFKYHSLNFHHQTKQISLFFTWDGCDFGSYWGTKNSLYKDSQPTSLWIWFTIIGFFPHMTLICDGPIYFFWWIIIAVFPRYTHR